MTSRVWNRSDLWNILLSIYATKLQPFDVAPAADDSPGAVSGERLYRWGCRAAIQSLMLAFGLPLHLLDQASPQPLERLPGIGTRSWWLEDLENVISALYRSILSTPVRDLNYPSAQLYRQGFSDVVEALLRALGSEEDPGHWQQEVLEDRAWDLSADEGGGPVRLIGSAPEEGSA